MSTLSDTKLFVGGLAWATSEANLRDAFARYGVLRNAIVITDRETGRSRGFGFVEFEKGDDAQRAQAAMDGVTLDGREVRVAFAEIKERSNGGRRDDDRGGRGSQHEYRSRDDDRGGNHPPVTHKRR